MIKKVCTVYYMYVPKNKRKKFEENAYHLYKAINRELGFTSGVSVECSTTDFDGILVVTIERDAKYSYRGAMTAIRKIVDSELANV